MARPIRVEYPDAAYHVTARGNERRPVFRNDEDHRLHLEHTLRPVGRPRKAMTTKGRYQA